MKHAVIGRVAVKAGSRGEVLRALLAHRERCLRDEPGTLQFEVLVPDDLADTILLFEVYTDTGAFNEHFDRGSSLVQARKEVGHLILSMSGDHCKLGPEFVSAA